MTELIILVLAPRQDSQGNQGNRYTPAMASTPNRNTVCYEQTSIRIGCA